MSSGTSSSLLRHGWAVMQCPRLDLQKSKSLFFPQLLRLVEYATRHNTAGKPVPLKRHQSSITKLRESIAESFLPAYAKVADLKRDVLECVMPLTPASHHDD